MAGTSAATTGTEADRPLTNANTSGTSASSGSSSAMSTRDQERLTKLGVLLVNVGAASEEKVFGVKGSIPMQNYQNHKMNDLLVINRREDDASAHPFHWYNPWTWWSSGRQVSPILRVPAGTAVASGQSTGSAETANSAAAAAASATQTEEAELFLPPVMEPKVKPKKKKGLPTVDMRPLSDDEAATLTLTVQEDRAKVMKAEEHLHKALQDIEDTRYRYLVPSRDLQCEAEVIAVVQCYSERHQAAAAAAQKAKSSAAPSDNIVAPLKVNTAVRANLLACGPDVQRLKKCAETVAMRYSHEGELA